VSAFYSVSEPLSNQNKGAMSASLLERVRRPHPRAHEHVTARPDGAVVSGPRVEHRTDHRTHRARVSQERYWDWGRAVGMHPRLAGYLLHDGYGALTHECDGHRVGTHAVACCPERGMGGAKEGGPGWLGSSPRRSRRGQQRLPRREANIEMRQTQPGTIQADNPLLLTARLDTAGGIGGHQISPAPHHGPAG
jgi:hypothetical protein